MKKTYKALLLTLCLLATLMLSGCYTNTDPWYGNTEVPQGTQLPQTQPTALVNEPTNEVQPAIDSVETTQQPGGEEAPGLNG